MIDGPHSLPWVSLHFIPQPEVRELFGELGWMAWDQAVFETDNANRSET